MFVSERRLESPFSGLVEPQLARFFIQHPEAGQIIIDYDGKAIQVQSVPVESVIEDPLFIMDDTGNNIKNWLYSTSTQGINHATY